jgi:AraC-like DNA-binding protein
MAVDGDLFRRLCRARDTLCDGVDEAPGLRALARVAGVAPHHFLRVFRRTFGETPHGYLTRLMLPRYRRDYGVSEQLVLRLTVKCHSPTL